MPRFSIILPTYNRRDTIMRAVNSVLAQTFADWELLITDDGSSDGTAQLLEGLDPRISLRRQDNAGMASARNAATRRSTGEYIAFIDSDDEWLPHYLELANAFFTAHPDEHLFSGEFWIDYGNAQYEKHFRASMDWFVPTAERIGLGGLRLPDGETDDYLRFYEKREQVGPWGRAIVEALPYENPRYYSGNIFEHFRFGYMLAAQSTVLSRTAFERVGELDPSYPAGCDFGFLATACRHYRAHMVSVPACIKHEVGVDGKSLAEGHIAKSIQFARDLLRWHDVLFYNDRPNDPEIKALRAFAQLYVGRVALEKGLIEEAVAQLSNAVTAFPGPEARLLLTAARVLPKGLAKSFGSQLYQTRARYDRIAVRVNRLLARVQKKPQSKSGAEVADDKAARPPDTSGIRQYRADDVDGLLKLRADIHGATSIFTDRGYFDWIYRGRPSVAGRSSQLWLHESADGIDAHAGTVPVELKIGESRQAACWFFDLAVGESTRGKGTAGALAASACQSAEAAMALEVTGPGRRLLLRSGWSDLGILTLYVRPIDSAIMLRKLAGPVPAVASLGNAALSTVSALGSAGAQLMRLVPREIQRFDEQADDIWNDASSAYPVVVRRDSRYLNWRFADFPHRGRYRLFYFYRGKKAVGYAVLRVGEHHGAPAGYIVDYFCKPRFTYGVLAHSVQHFERAGMAHVYCLHLNPVTAAPLLALGFIPRNSGWPFVADLQKLSAAQQLLARDSRNWFITAGDGDVDRPHEAEPQASPQPAEFHVA